MIKNRCKAYTIQASGVGDGGGRTFCWKLVRINGSHHVFEKAGKGHYSVPVHRGRVKAFYAREAKRKAAEN